MRFFAPLLLCVGIALAVAGCDPATNKQYFREGIGPNLYAEDVAAQTDRQDAYVADICHQAGLLPGTCDIDTFNPRTWGQFVQAGMNDIDRRCDAYLTWLDYVRRAREPTIKQLSDMQTASTAIMGATGVGTAPIAIVAAAVGLATNTFTNVTSRLILEVDHSTVQAVVLSHQKEYREVLFGTDKKPGVVIASKPAAIYALRSYLRLCMPMTIETQINNTIATFSRGGGKALDDQAPMISAKTVGVRVATAATDDSYTVLRALLFPNGAKKADPDLVAYARKLLGSPTAPVGFILTTNPRFATLRKRLAACIIARRDGHPCADGSLSRFIQ